MANFKAVSGWTWFAITLEEIYGNSILTFYAAHDSYTGLITGLPARSESTTLAGFYTDPLPAAKPNLKINFGCRRNSDQVCYRAMIGYFFQFKVWADKGLKVADLAFEISNSCGATGGCNVCWQANQCFSQRSNVIFELDLEQNTQTLLSRVPSGTYSFIVGDTNVASTFDDPIRVMNQGLRFSKNKFIKNNNSPNI